MGIGERRGLLKGGNNQKKRVCMPEKQIEPK